MSRPLVSTHPGNRDGHLEISVISVAESDRALQARRLAGGGVDRRDSRPE